MPCRIFGKLGASLACRTVYRSLVLRCITTSRSVFHERRSSSSLTAGQHGANSSGSSLSGFSAQSDISSPLGPSRAISPLQAPTLVILLLGVKTKSPDNLVVRNEPTLRSSTSSPSASSSDSSPSLPLRHSHHLCSKRPRRDIRGLESVPPSVSPWF
ncbi:hypothetical protein DL96DRAFT_567897 [Flagelloscypha sp. PMI_526]|nr:hypothetical protein DL96DRAFT_567897 [Flagelloscypha sp. PMI_526]